MKWYKITEVWKRSGSSTISSSNLNSAVSKTLSTVIDRMSRVKQFILFILAFTFQSSTCFGCKDSQQYMSLSNHALFEEASGGKKVGGCYIKRNENGPCDIYVMTATVGASGDQGWPRNIRNEGNGCVRAPDFPNGFSKCLYVSADFSNWPLDNRQKFCSDSGIDNAAEQLRHAILNNHCDIPNCNSEPEDSLPSSVRQAWNLDTLVPEAQQDGWNCGHSPGSGSCFWTTAKYVADLAKSCGPCAVDYLFPGNQEDNSPVPTLTPEQQTVCPDCIPTVVKAPKCGGTLLGIGSGRKGTSCKLVDGHGCWPLRSAPVSHDCGAGHECRFKVSDAKAKVWCCRRATRCKWYQARCHWRNTFRCSNSALSSSKDKNGAQVLWQ